MPRFLLIAAIVAVALMVFAFVDAAYFDRMRVRGIPKAGWLVVILFVPIAGALLWFFVGRGPRGGSSSGGARRGPIAPDDDPEFLRNLKPRKPDDEPGS